MTRPREGVPEDVLDHVATGADLVVGMANGEPVAAIDALEREHGRLAGVRIHQMHAMRRRPYIDGAYGDRLRHVSLFLTGATREAAWAGACDVVPADFSGVPRLLREHTDCSLLLVSASPPDDDGWCTLGTNADYAAALLGDVPVFLEVNERMPRTAGTHRVRLADAVGWYRADRPLVPAAGRPPDDRDRAIAALVAERIPDGATLQVGIGAVPDAVCAALRGHRGLGLHSELLSDGAMDLIERGVMGGPDAPGPAVATFALGSARLYGWMDEEPRIALDRVDRVNDPRRIALRPRFFSVNATTEVDLLGQCASETMGGRPWSGSGGQADFAAGALGSPGGAGFVVLHATTGTGRSRIRAALTPGSVVTTPRNLVDHVVTEWGIASLRGRTIRERATALIAVADPAHRDDLEREARAAGLLPRLAGRSSPAASPAVGRAGLPRPGGS